jgi:DNA ligase-1
VQDEFGSLLYSDGEVVEGDPTGPGVFNRTQSHVMSRDKPGELSYYVFDCIDPEFLDQPFYKRLEETERRVKTLNRDNVIYVEHEFVDNYEELLACEERFLNLGFEGIFLRNPMSPYKSGRATFKQNIAYKLKRFEDAEGIIIALEEQETNNNVQERDALGYAKRTTHKAGKIGARTLGKFIVQFGPQVIHVSPGVFTHKERQEIFYNPTRYIGQTIKFRYFAYGCKDLPRFANALGFRRNME